MTKPQHPALAAFVTALAGRNMTRAAYVAVALGMSATVLLTMDPAYEAGRRWIIALLWGCLVFFVVEWAVRVQQAARAHRAAAYLMSGRGLLDTLSGLAVPVALVSGMEVRTAWLLAVIWVLKVTSGVPGLRQLRRVLVVEARPLLSVLVLFLGSVAEYALEHDEQPATFGTIPSALWWAVATLTTTGYGDVVPITPLGRVVAATVMISGLGVLGLWTGILATGFAAETRRDNFLKTWESVSWVPFFASLGPSTIADVAQMLHTIDLPPRAIVIRKGKPGDCMYFIASGEVEVDLPGKKVRLGEGGFFGEMALLGNNLRSADISTTGLSKLLVLDLVDFRVLMARHPDLAQSIDAEARRRTMENRT
ncbi:cyclic nucleotide-gated ion channel [Bradyrhizobium sp. SZCCHNR1051]|uniref:cyclic nucleotide-gated ion channel n=1 Tax=Bradyrhizobium sp. SZCCHNR1051 TaxID=3057355 RepID=UPI00291669DE|nr:cyclic nucleotide-gated ion channel [Bradyrhizobium sp. SZCCHNR1051]